MEYEVLANRMAQAPASFGWPKGILPYQGTFEINCTSATHFSLGRGEPYEVCIQAKYANASTNLLS